MCLHSGSPGLLSAKLLLAPHVCSQMQPVTRGASDGLIVGISKLMQPEQRQILVFHSANSLFCQFGWLCKKSTDLSRAMQRFRACRPAAQETEWLFQLF